MDKIEELLTRGVDKIYPTKESLEQALKSGKKLTLYQGFDPTGDQLHIGHMIGLRKLKQWQDLGHHVIFLIGDGTGQAGDPSGKMSAREKFFTHEELRRNAKEYVMQAAKIMRFDGENPVEIRYNGDWLNELTFPEILEIIDHLSLQQLIERDLFQDRLKRNERISLREFIYPILQGYDSVALNVDLEVGGTDQTFNMLVGRQLLKDYKQKEKFVMTTPLLEDSSGRKIGKTEGNVIALTDTPENLYGKIMSLGDDVIVKGLELLTDVPMDEVGAIAEKIKEGENPMTFKKRLAFEITKQLNSESSARAAQEHFEKTVQKGEAHTESIETKTFANTATVIDAVMDFGFAQSRSDAKRLIDQGGVSLDDTVTKNPLQTLENGQTIRVGSRKFGKIEIH